MFAILLIKWNFSLCVFRHYAVNFRRVMRAVDFEADSTICFKRLVMQPRPPIPFVREGWSHDLPCSFNGPNSLYQRWNVAIRQGLGMLDRKETIPTQHELRILLLVRSIGSERANIPNAVTSRVMVNIAEIQAAIEQLAKEKQAKLIVQDLSLISFEEQVRLIGNSSIIVGMHGAGIASSVHLPIGTKYCCGVLEMFPHGDFQSVRGYGNIARQMGHHYNRLDLLPENTGASGSTVPILQLKTTLTAMINHVLASSTCILPSVLKNSFG